MPEVCTAFSFEDMSHPAAPQKNTSYAVALTNYFHFARRIGARDGRLARQIHSTTIIEAPRGLPGLPLIPTLCGEGDAIWTDEPGNWVGVLTADCLPLLFESRSKVMAVHAGWKGLSRGIIAKAVEFLGVSDILQVTIGPAAGACCYTVHSDVVSVFRRNGIEPVTRGSRIDLPETAVRQLAALGVSRVARSSPFGCTICDRRFHSFRRDGTAAGRNLAAIAVL